MLGWQQKCAPKRIDEREREEDLRVRLHAQSRRVTARDARRPAGGYPAGRRRNRDSRRRQRLVRRDRRRHRCGRRSGSAHSTPLRALPWRRPREKHRLSLLSGIHHRLHRRRRATAGGVAGGADETDCDRSSGRCRGPHRSSGRPEAAVDDVVLPRPPWRVALAQGSNTHR